MKRFFAISFLLISVGLAQREPEWIFEMPSDEEENFYWARVNVFISDLDEEPAGVITLEETNIDDIEDDEMSEVTEEIVEDGNDESVTVKKIEVIKKHVFYIQNAWDDQDDPPRAMGPQSATVLAQ